MRKKFYNIKLDILSTQDCLLKIDTYLDSDDCNVIAFLNAHCFNIAQNNKEYRKALNAATLLLNDGIGVKIACLLNGIRPIENMNGTDLIPQVIKHTTKKNKKIFLMGGEPGIAEKARKKIESLVPDVNISGTHSGFFNPEEEQSLIDSINSSGAELLIVGMGVPKQELWVAKNRPFFKNIKVVIPGGAILDFLAEKHKRAPGWIQKLGFEWLFRLVQEPRRLAKRYLIGNFQFMYTIFKYKIFPSKIK